MTIPFGQLIESTDNIDGGTGIGAGGGTVGVGTNTGGGAGGSTTPPPTPTPTPTINDNSCISEGGPCGGIVIGNCCAGLNCDGGDENNIGVCIKPPTPTPTITVSPTGTEPGRSTIACCGPSTNNTCVAIPNATACPRGTAECVTLGESCAPTRVYCNYKDISATCESVLGQGYTGTAIKTDLVLDVTGNPLPLGCIPDARIDTSWNTGECVRIEPSTCNYVEEEIQCNALQGLENYTGIASRRVLQVNSNGNPLPLGCVIDPNINTAWNTTGCQSPPPGCTPPPGPFEQVISVTCASIDPNRYNAGTATKRQQRDYIQVSANSSEVCPYTEWTDVSTDTTDCRFVESTCTPPTGPFTRTVDVACTAINDNFISGVAKQVQTREYTINSAAGTTCPYTDWVDSGAPDTSFCKVVNNPTTCTSPEGPFSQQISIPCSQVDIKYTQGTAIQTQVRRYDASVEGPGPCPYTEWENYGEPNIATCVQPVYWRNCVTGQLIEGNAPQTYIQSNYPQGGVCWEPPTDLGFIPSLSEALRYTYQRGSAKLPESRTIRITNPSPTIAYSVKITTNQNIALATDTNQSGKGTIAFTISPRAEIKLIITVTPELLQQLQDGVSTLSVNVEYDRVL